MAAPAVVAAGKIAMSAVASKGGKGKGAGASGGASGGGGMIKQGLSKGKSMASPANAIMLAQGLVKTISGKRQMKKADEMMPQREDPEERQMHRYFQRRKRAFATGTANAAERNSLQQAMKTGMTQSFRAGGGVKGLNMMSRMMNQGLLGLKQTAQKGELDFAREEAKAGTAISGRKLQLGLLKYNTAQARAAQKLKEGKAATGLAASRMLGAGKTDSSGGKGSGAMAKALGGVIDKKDGGTTLAAPKIGGK